MNILMISFFGFKEFAANISRLTCL